MKCTNCSNKMTTVHNGLLANFQKSEKKLFGCTMAVTPVFEDTARPRFSAIRLVRFSVQYGFFAGPTQASTNLGDSAVLNKTLVSAVFNLGFYPLQCDFRLVRFFRNFGPIMRTNRGLAVYRHGPFIFCNYNFTS